LLILTFFSITVIGLLIATYTDLKERMVYNKLTYTLIGLGIGLKIIETIKTQSTEPILTAIAGGVIAFAVAYLLWRLGVWAGGDVKLVTAIAVINPINYAALAGMLSLTNWPFTTINLPIFSISIIIYSALAVFPLGLLMSLTAVTKHPRILEKTIETLKEKAKQIVGLGVLIAGTRIILGQLGVMDFFVLVVLVGMTFLPKKIRLWSTIAIALAGLALNIGDFVLNSVYVILPLLFLYGFWKLYSESKEFAFKQTIQTAKLEEGMIPDKYLVEKGSKVELVERPSIKRVIKNLMNNRIENSLEDFQIKGKIIASPSQAGGITGENVKLLKEKAEKGLAPKKIVVRKTMAFVPAILIAYLALQLTGDLLWNLILA